MICDNCGKSNATGVVTCAYCGSDMPKTTECAGFGDILTYKAPEPVAPVTPVVENDEGRRIYETDIKKSPEKTGGKTTITKSNIILIGICSLVLIVSIIIGVSMISCEDSGITPDGKEEIENTPEENSYSDTGYKALTDLAGEIGEVIIKENPYSDTGYKALTDLAGEIGNIIKDN